MQRRRHLIAWLAAIALLLPVPLALAADPEPEAPVSAPGTDPAAPPSSDGDAVTGTPDPGAAPPTAGAAPRPPERSLSQWYALGGWVMHLIALCSVLAGGVVLERAWALRSRAVAPPDVVEELRRAGGAGRLEQVRALTEGSSSSLARLVRVGLRALERGAAHPLEHVASAGEAEALRLRRNLPLLAALANLATMLGLLGTVLGMIEAFDVIAAVGTGDARVVARGIFQALVTTAAGLGVGIGALAAHAALRRRAEQGLLTLETLLNELFDRPAAEATEAPPAQAVPRVGAPAPASGSR